MKLRSSKAAMYAGVGMVMSLMPVLPVVADAQTTYEQQESTVAESENLIQASYTANISDIVATGYEEDTQADVFAEQAVNVTAPFLNVYEKNSENSEIVGKLYENGIADTLEVGKEWTKIQSGNVIGFVTTQSLCFGEEAEQISVEIDGAFDTAYTVEEAEAKEEAERIAAEEAEAARIAAEEEAQRQAAAQASVTYMSGMSASNEELLILATVIDWEAGWESYEGKLAVANVVLNRVRSGAYGDSITSVVYARNQFSGVSDGAGNASSRFAARLAAGPRTEECMEAALEALAGVNNIGGYTSFRSLSVANYSAYSSYMIIGNHCFF